ncbi:hypothetical protein D3C72_1611390 [compost metagenome]
MRKRDGAHALGQQGVGALDLDVVHRQGDLVQIGRQHGQHLAFLYRIALLDQDRPNAGALALRPHQHVLPGHDRPGNGACRREGAG